jgi:anti-sigma regulatory factor (Ser/Thr protein kinase)
MERLDKFHIKFSKSLEALGRNLDFFSKQTRELEPVISEARNATTHDYNEETAQEIYIRVTEYYHTLKSIELCLCDHFVNERRNKSDE